MKELTLSEFNTQLSSAAPVPGGGGASALMGALSASLCSMVANLTSGKKKYAMYQQDIERILKKAAMLRDEMLDLIEKDAEAFEPLSKAYSIPKDDPERDSILEEKLYEAAKAPALMVFTTTQVAQLLEELAIKGSRLVLSDVAVAAASCRACAEGAAMNVYINTKLMKDRDRASQMNDDVEKNVRTTVRICEDTYNTVLKELLS